MCDILFIADEDPAQAIYKVHWDGNKFNTIAICLSPVGWAESTFVPVNFSNFMTNHVQLNGVVSDDGEIFSPTTNLWSVFSVSGPGTVSLGNATQTNTIAEFSAPGDYVLQLSAYDGQYTVSSNVTIHVIQNQPPAITNFVNLITNSTSVVLSARVTDDGWPSNHLHVGWSQVSGATFTFNLTTNLNPNTTNYLATNSISSLAAGTYVILLEADDGQATNLTEVVVTVQQPCLTMTPTFGIPSGSNSSFSVIARLVDDNSTPITNSQVKFSVSGINATNWTGLNRPKRQYKLYVLRYQ